MHTTIEKKAEIDEHGNTVRDTVEDGQEKIDENKEEMLSKKDEIDKNNKEIDALKKRQEEKLAEITQKKNELGIANKKSESKAHETRSRHNTNGAENSRGANNPSVANGTNGANGTNNSSRTNNSDDAKNATSAMPPMDADGVKDNDLLRLIQEYNGIGVDIAGLETINEEFTNNILEGAEENTEIATDAIDVSQEELDSIDQVTGEIVSTMDSAQGAVKELQSFLEGNFKTLDKKTVITLAKECVKAGINGTQSGVLAAAAAAMGASSIFTFGQTAQKAADLSRNSVKTGVASGKEIAANTAGKMLESYAKQMVNQVVNTTTQGLCNLAGLDQETISQINDLTSSLQNDLLANFMNENGISNDEEGESNSTDNNSSKPTNEDNNKKNENTKA